MEPAPRARAGPQSLARMQEGGIGGGAGRTVALLVLRPPQNGQLLSVALDELARKRHLAQRHLGPKVGTQPAERQVVACSVAGGQVWAHLLQPWR